MNRKLPLDIAIIISSITGAILSFVYLKTPTEKYYQLGNSYGLCTIFPRIDNS